MSELAKHYKARYRFYKKKCQEMESLLTRFRDLLNETSRGPQTSPLDSPPAPELASKVDQNRSPILGLGRKAASICRKRLELTKGSDESVGSTMQHATKTYELTGIKIQDSNVSDKDDDDGDELADFEPGSNKWECIEEKDLGSYLEETADLEKQEDQPTVISRPLEKRSSSPLEQLRKMRTEPTRTGLRLNKAIVSSNIRGVKRRLLPGQTCYKCEDYMKAAGLGEDFINKASRHRCTHERPKTPPGFWSMDLEAQTKQILQNRKRTKLPL